MISADIKFNTSQLKNMTKKIKNDLAQLPHDSLLEFQKLTPIRSGNARRRTQLRNQKTIVADYPYAQRLDTGYSRQAPNGMTQPFARWFQQRVAKIFGGK